MQDFKIDTIAVSTGRLTGIIGARQYFCHYY